VEARNAAAEGEQQQEWNMVPQVRLGVRKQHHFLSSLAAVIWCRPLHY
jgi:hypothetical protein